MPKILQKVLMMKWLEKVCFPDSLKEAEVIPVFEDKGNSNDKSNY